MYSSQFLLVLLPQVYEILDNAIDEVQSGFAHTVKVGLAAVHSFMKVHDFSQTQLLICICCWQVEMDLSSGWVTISDDGRGIPTSIHPQTGRSALETVLTVLHAGGKFGGQGSGYSVSGGLHGVGISVVNALSEELHVTVWWVPCSVLLSGGHVPCIAWFSNVMLMLFSCMQAARQGTPAELQTGPTSDRAARVKIAQQDCKEVGDTSEIFV